MSLLTVAAMVTFAPAKMADPVSPAAASATPTEHPVELKISAIEITVAVKPVGLTADRHLELPAFGEGGWYRLGPKPGEVGHAVIAGHVDSRTGPDIFYRLHTLEPGDEVRVRMSTGSVVTFKVDEVGRQPKEDLPLSPMWRASDRPQLALITCGGEFDSKRRTYTENLVVYATAA